MARRAQDPKRASPEAHIPRAPDCRDFTGYRPCRPGYLCEKCRESKPAGASVLLINLDATGNVMQTTAALPAILGRWPGASITWVTLSEAAPLLDNNPHVWRVVPYSWEAVNILREMSFDVVLNADKTQRSCALAMSVRSPVKLGFALSPHGAIEPFNPEAEHLWRLGVDDELKFRKNELPGTRLLAESWGLEWRRDEYVLVLTDEERAFVEQYRRSQELDGRYAVGLNTGCSAGYPNKKMTVEQLARLARLVTEAIPRARILLLGGASETERNAEIARMAGVPVVRTPTTEGLRRGILYIAACDAVVTGDTAAMHIAIALRKWVVAHFGLSCASEIDLYDRGVKIASSLECSPCWRKVCKWPTVRCIDGIDLDGVVEAVRRGESALR